MASRIIGHAARAMAKSYLRVVLQEVVLSITTAEPGTFEVDPDKVPLVTTTGNLKLLTNISGVARERRVQERCCAN
jgi:hypothetical protein